MNLETEAIQRHSIIGAGIADEPADPGDPGGAHLENRSFRLVEVLDLLELLFRMHLHGAELEHRKEVLAQPNQLLDKKTSSMARAIRGMNGRTRAMLTRVRVRSKLWASP